MSLLLLIKDILLTSKFLFYDFELYVDELYNNIILYFQFFLTQIHKIITSRFFYEKYLTENDEKIVDSIEFSQCRRFELCRLESGSTRMHGLRESAMAPFNKGHLLSEGGIGIDHILLDCALSYLACWLDCCRVVGKRQTDNTMRVSRMNNNNIGSSLYDLYHSDLLSFSRNSATTCAVQSYMVYGNRSWPRSYIQVSRLVDFLSGGGVFTYGSHHLLRRMTTTRCSDREVTAAHAHSLLERDEIVGTTCRRIDQS